MVSHHSSSEYFAIKTKRVSICAQLLLATEIGGATAIQK